MAICKVVVNLQMDSGLPNDSTVNVWWCQPVSLPTGLDDFVDDLNTLYSSLDGYLSKQVDATAVTWTAYNWADAEPRVPIGSGTFTAISPGTTGMPPELAVCISYKATYVSGEPPARYRGRVYFGPLSATAFSSSSPDLLASGVSSDFANAAEVLLTASLASSTYKWVMHSERDDAVRVITGGWVDNAWDIQRRRGVLPTVRTVYP